MPANLPPHYHEAEKRYREAKELEDKIEALEEMLAIIPKHKGTDKLKADLRRRISKHKEQQLQRKGGAKLKSAFSIEREGAAQVTLVGPPNTGKSSLVAILTKAAPEIADFPHTTHKPTPGMATYENIQFQLIDTEPITAEYSDPSLIDFLRRTDIVAIVLDLDLDPFQQLAQMMDVFARNRIFPETEALPEGLIKKPFIKKMLIVVNKVDNLREQEDFETFRNLCETSIPSVGVSCRSGRNLQSFLAAVYDMSGVIRVYTKSPGKAADLNKPFIITRNSTLEELARKIHKDFADLKYARVWGEAVHGGQMVQRDYTMRDGDIVEIHK